MSRDIDRRAHADALFRQRRSDQGARFRRAVRMVLATTALGTCILPYATLNSEHFTAAGTYAVADLVSWAGQGTPWNPNLTFHYMGKAYLLSARQIASDPYFQNAGAGVTRAMIHGTLWGFGLGMAGLFGFGGLRRRRREKALADRVITGTLVTTEAKLAKLTCTEANARALHIGSVPLPNRLETRHMAMIGTTGSGKTTALRQLLDGIEARGEAALVYDTSGEFIAHYYNPARGDVILNPFDARCAFWSPFDEIAHAADADRIAHQLITETGQNDRDVWLETSRILVANMLRALWKEGKCTLDDLLIALRDRTKDDLKVWLGNSSSSRTFAEDADRATGSVLFMLAKAANLIQFLRIEGSGEPFDFRNFINGLDKRSGPRPWIFVPRKEDYFEASKPLLACWLECAASAVLGLPPSPDRRIWFILDELADLPRVENMARLLPEGRKFGAAVVLTFQALGQMRHRYGPQIAESMLGCCNTKLFLQTIDSETRLWASQTIGDCEVEIQTMTDALASGDDAPRTTLSKTRKVRPAILESELRLPKYEGFLLFPDGLPVARIRMTADHLKTRGAARQPGFIAGDMKATLWEQIANAPPSAPPPPTQSGDGPV